MHDTEVYEGKSKMAAVLSCKSLMRCKISWYMRGFNGMRMFVFELYYVYFLFGVKCLELCWYDSAQPYG